MAFRLIHTADWQLGKRFANIPGDTGAVLRERRLEAVRDVARLAAERGADAVLVAGDAFDDNAVSDRTLAQALAALEGFAGDWVFVPGNHDPALANSVWERLARQDPPPNVHLLVEPGRPLLLGGGRAAVLPGVLRRRHEAEDPTAWFDGADTPADAVRVGLAHGSVAELLPAEAASHNPIAAGRAAAARLDYLALGDWHGTLEVDARTWYAGTPEPDRFGSRDPGNVLAVSLPGPGEAPAVDRAAVGRFAWRTESAAVHAAADVEALDARLSGLADPADACLLRLSVSGTLDFTDHTRLRAVLKRWGERLRHLDLRDSGLLAEPSDDDLDRIDRDGFVRAAVERLRQRSGDPDDPDRETARAAMLRLYLLHVEREG